jgi:excisionase family DNA binding protein
MEWLTTGQAAKALGVSSQTIRRMYAQGRIKGHRTGGATKRRGDLRIPSSEVARLLKENHNR